MKKKILALALCVAMLAISVVSGTLAYFTDTETEDNVFTVGSVQIDLLESQYHREVDDVDDDAIIIDDETYQDVYLAEQGKEIVPGRWVRKAPYVKNTGISDAYVRVKVEFPKAFWDEVDLMLTTTAEEDGSILPYTTTETADSYILTFTYAEALKSGEMTYWPAFWQFRINPALDQAAIADFQQLENVLTVTAEAVQAEGFANVTEAFAAVEGQISDFDIQ